MGRIDLDCIEVFGSDLSEVYFEDVELISSSQSKIDEFKNSVSGKIEVKRRPLLYIYTMFPVTFFSFFLTVILILC